MILLKIAALSLVVALLATIAMAVAGEFTNGSRGRKLENYSALVSVVALIASVLSFSLSVLRLIFSL